MGNFGHRNPPNIVERLPYELLRLLNRGLSRLQRKLED